MTGIPYFTIVRFIVPYLLSLMVAWMIIAFWPPLSTILRGLIVLETVI